MKKISVWILAMTAAFAGCDRPPVPKDPIDRNTIDHSKMDHSRMGHSMESSPGAASAPYVLQFLDTMIAHHQGAIDMALLADTRAQHAELKTLALKIIKDQRKEVAEMSEMRSRLFGAAAPAINMDMPGMRDGMKGMDLTKLDALKANDFDLEFIAQMIPHHEGAVVMAGEAPAKGLVKADAGQSTVDNNRLVLLCGEIIKSQTAEIEQMRLWQKAWKK